MSAIVTEAREWLGTPFHEQASVKGVGADCVGLITGIARTLARPEGDSFHARITNHRPPFDPRQLREGLAANFDRVADMEPGDILCLVVRGKAQHLAIYAGGGRMIHTYGKGPSCVVEVSVGNSRPIDSIWRWRA